LQTDDQGTTTKELDFDRPISRKFSLMSIL